MPELYDLYKKGTTLWESLELVRKKITITTARPGEPQNIAGRVRALEYQMSEIQNIWESVHQPQPQHEREKYEAEICQYKEAIEHLESLAKNALTDQCTEGIFVGLGFVSSYPPNIAIIHPNEWSFLEIDFKESSAVYTNGTYKKIRLVNALNLTKDDFQFIIKISTAQIEARIKSNSPHPSTSPQTVKNYHMGDTYHIQQAAAVGPQATAHNTTNVQNNSTSSINYTDLENQLSNLRGEMRKIATTADHDESLGAVAAAEKAVQNKDIKAAETHLKRAGSWALSVAEKLGVGLAVKFIEKSITG